MLGVTLHCSSESLYPCKEEGSALEIDRIEIILVSEKNADLVAILMGAWIALLTISIILLSNEFRRAARQGCSTVSAQNLRYL